VTRKQRHTPFKERAARDNGNAKQGKGSAKREHANLFAPFVLRQRIIDKEQNKGNAAMQDAVFHVMHRQRGFRGVRGNYDQKEASNTQKALK
jgi:hypothetical protein